MWSIVIFLVALLTDRRAAIAVTSVIGIGLTMTFGLAGRMRASERLDLPSPDAARLFAVAVFSVLVVILIARVFRWAYFKAKGWPLPPFL